MIKPRTVGELVKLLEEDRIDEIDPEWMKETFETSQQIVILLMLKDKEKREE